MSLPFIKNIKDFIGKKDSEALYFLILEIKDGYLKAAVYKTISGQIEVIGSSSEKISENWEDITAAADKIITQASNGVPDEKIKNTLLGLPAYWIVDGKVKPEILDNLKKLCKQLELTPMGFIVITEALLAQIQKKEQAPLTCILVELGRLYHIISIIRVGVIQISKQLDAQSSSLCDQMVEILRNLPERDVLPSRILLYDEEIDLEKVRQEIISYPWNQKASFLHFPKVETLPKEYDLDGVILASSKEIKNRFSTEAENTVENQPAPNIAGADQGEGTTTDDLGFIEDQDILEIQKPKAPIQVTPVPEEEIVPPPLPPPLPPPVVTPSKIAEYAVQPEIKPDLIPEKKPTKLNLPKFSFAPIFNIFQNSRQSAIIGILVLVFLAVFAFFAYYNFARATVTLFIEPGILEKEMEIAIKSEKEKINPANIEIQGEVLETDVEQTLTKKTTGEKTVGEKAGGEVTLYNKTTTGSKTLKNGTILIGPDEKEFILDSDITIPVATSEQEGITFGKAKVKVTASEIGTEYNLSSGKKEFSVKEFPTSSYSAATDTAFTGGSSRKVKIVSENDQKQLSAELLKKSLAKAKNNFVAQVAGKKELIIDSLEKISQKDSFTPKIDEESEEVTLSSKISFRILSYSKADIQKIIDQQIKKSVSDDYEYEKNQLTIKITDVLREETDDNNITKIQVRYSLKLIPKYDTLDIQKNLTGKNLNYAGLYLKTLNDVGGYELSFSPQFPDKFLFFPRNYKNIQIKIVPKE